MSHQDRTADIAIVGGGIMGLAHAYMALRKGHRVVLFERDEYAVGASIRNFGLVWPIGQEPGAGLTRATKSREHWLEIAQQVGCWINQNGSIHLAYHDDEWDVLNEFVSLYGNEPGFDLQLLSPKEVFKKSSVINPAGLKGGLWSSTECTVNPREAIRKIPLWLEEKYGLILRFGHVVKEIRLPDIQTSKETWSVDKVFVCSGADFETLYPEVFAQYPVTKCKLQMMKAVSIPGNFTFGPTLCAGLTLRHYAAFRRCLSLRKLDERYDAMDISFKENGIHVLLAQNNHGELIIGDSHHYGLTIEPFESEEVNDKIIGYLNSFVSLADFKITERWHGVYPKVQNGIDLIVEPEKNVTIVNCIGGAGMTLSFGLAEEVLEAAGMLATVSEG